MDATEKTKNAPDLQCLPSLCRGLYNRVAQKLGCDPSYVSRVARGERTSKAISEALRAEITWAMANIGFENGSGKKANGTNGKSAGSRKGADL
ncbi:MAG TPA: helix-turn-helix transcriptional regulator [Candidatus Acidoferrum sp.]|nr:helix-turn-helix transcriptional regulator [Candidatus Acidoferrum sp.]